MNVMHVFMRRVIENINISRNNKTRIFVSKELHVYHQAAAVERTSLLPNIKQLMIKMLLMFVLRVSLIYHPSFGIMLEVNYLLSLSFSLALSFVLSLYIALTLPPPSTHLPHLHLPPSLPSLSLFIYYLSLL